jgi:hypothetical protein
MESRLLDEHGWHQMARKLWWRLSGWTKTLFLQVLPPLFLPLERPGFRATAHRTWSEHGGESPLYQRSYTTQDTTVTTTLALHMYNYTLTFEQYPHNPPRVLEKMSDFLMRERFLFLFYALAIQPM